MGDRIRRGHGNGQDDWEMPVGIHWMVKRGWLHSTIVFPGLGDHGSGRRLPHLVPANSRGGSKPRMERGVNGKEYFCCLCKTTNCKMPVHRGVDHKGPYYQWGYSTGKKYYYSIGDARSREVAKMRAIKQGQAVHASGWHTL